MNDENIYNLINFGYICIAATLIGLSCCMCNKKSEKKYFLSVPLKNVIVDELPAYESKKNDNK
jgi:hypothetical protein